MEQPRQAQSVKKSIKKIRQRLWMILLAAVVPFLLLVVAIVMQADTTNEQLLVVAIFLFAAGLASLATRLASYSIVERYLEEITMLDRAKSEFISVASHQLKTPVTSLKYTMDVFKDAIAENDDEKIRDFANDIELSVNRLNALTHQLLDVARAESGRLEAEEEKFQIKSKMKHYQEELEPLAEENDLTFAIDCQLASETTVTLDPDFLYNVVDNLVTNAFHYAPKDSEVTLICKEKEGGIHVAVTNMAEGIDEEDLDNVFEKFKRGKNKKKNTSGSGLGLFIARSYVEYWGGGIDAKLNDDTVTFSFTIPSERVSKA